MRTYSGFLLLEDVLDYIPQDSAELYQFSQRVINPTVRVIQEDCFTKIGKQLDVNYEIEGLIELATDLTITKTRIDELLAAGTYKVAVRNLHTCTIPTGICRKCFAGTYIDATIPEVGAFIRLEPEYNYRNDVFRGTGITSVFTLSQLPTDYLKVIVFINGVPQTTHTILDNVLTLVTSPAIGTNVVVKYYTKTSQPFVGLLSRTYSGSLLGMRPLDTQTINIRPSLAQQSFSDEEIEIAKRALQTNYKVITRNYIDYLDTIADKLEKAIYISMLYGLYSNVTA